MTIREKYAHNINALPRGLFNSEEDAWALLQAIILRFNVLVDVDEDDARVEVIYAWLRKILPECIQQDVMIIRGSRFSERRFFAVETYKAALSKAIWGQGFTHVFLGNITSDEVQLLSMNEAPTAGVRLKSDSDKLGEEVDVITFSVGNRFTQITATDADDWFSASQGNSSDVSKAREIIASMVEMNRLASAANYHHCRIPGAKWRNIFQWINGQAFAEGRDTLQLKDLLAMRYLMPREWLDYTVNHWSAKLSSEHYPVVEPLLKELRESSAS